MEIGVFGGSFNPPHYGHLQNANMALGVLDEVWFVPSGGHHPFAKTLAPFQDRLLMTQALIEGEDRLRVSDVENMYSLSYTVDVLRKLAEMYPEHQFHLVMGMDCWLDRHKWKSFDEIERDYTPVVIQRQGYSNAVTCPVGYSSTEIRNAIQNGEDVSMYMPAKVAEKALTLYR